MARGRRGPEADRQGADGVCRQNSTAEFSHRVDLQVNRMADGARRFEAAPLVAQNDRLRRARAPDGLPDQRKIPNKTEGFPLFLVASFG
jgi:hypothetical protein